MLNNAVQPGSTASGRRGERAFELDALRGLALFLMVLHHLAFDLRYLFAKDVFAFQECWWFNHLLRPVFLLVFLVVSGICCSFSRSNTRRGLLLLAVAALVTVLSLVAAVWFALPLAILFNMLHVLALGTLFYAALTWRERRTGRESPAVDVFLLLAASVVIYLFGLLPAWADSGSYWLLPFGLPPVYGIDMADYLPLIPWVGFFMIGAVIGRRIYSGRTSAFPNAPSWVITLTRPLTLAGRNSLLIYVLHQPVLLGILFALRFIGLI